MGHDSNDSAGAEGAGITSSAGRAATIVIADDEWMFRASLRQLLTAPPPVIKDVYRVDVGAGFSVVGEAGTGEDTVAVVRTTTPDLLLLDVDMPRLSGLDALRELDGAPWQGRTTILAGNITRSELLKAVQLGVRGIVLKDAPTEVLFESMLAVLAGRRWLDRRLTGDLMELAGRLACANPSAQRGPFGLTRREREVLALVAAGCANKEIARTCAVSEETIKHHLTRIFDKVGASNRLELALIATESGLLNEPAAVHPPEPAPPSPAPGLLKTLTTSG